MFSRINIGRVAKYTAQLRSYTKLASNDQIYVHKMADNGFKFSFSSNPRVLGLGYGTRDQDVNPNNFQPNDVFVSLLHDNIGKSVEQDFTFVMEAGVNVSSYMPIYDMREIPRYARVPEIDNIFGYVQVDDSGKIVPGSYQSNEMYRVCNGTGLTKLSDYLLEKVQLSCEEVTQ
jgi:hypothetical protein